MEKTLCSSGSLFGNSTVVPTRIGSTWGTKRKPFWSIVAAAAGTGNVPLMSSTETTKLPRSVRLPFAVILPSMLWDHRPAVSIAEQIHAVPRRFIHFRIMHLEVHIYTHGAVDP